VARHVDHFLSAVQMRCARVAVGPSTVRGQRTPGLVRAAREFLCEVPLAQFGTSKAPAFRAHLDQATRDLTRALPVRGRSWGIARKLVNIFLRDALYTSYLRDAFRRQGAANSGGSLASDTPLLSRNGSPKSCSANKPSDSRATCRPTRRCS
jgi:hypothetical protein